MTIPSRTMRLLLVSLAVLVSASGWAQGKAATSAQHPYALGATVSCLHGHGGIVGGVRPTNARLRALRDLAQKTSRQVRIQGVVLGLAFTRSMTDASLLLELLRVPNDPMRLELRRNVVLLSPKAKPKTRALVIGCLRS